MEPRTFHKILTLRSNFTRQWLRKIKYSFNYLVWFSHLSQDHFSPFSLSDIDKKKPRTRRGFFKNGGVSGIHCTENFPQIQVVDKITLKAKKPTIDEIFLKQKYVTEGLSSNEIAKLTFSSRPKITRLLKQYKIPLKTLTRRNNGGHVYGYRRFGGKAVEMKKEQEVIVLIKSYRESGYSYQRIADILNNRGICTKTKRGSWYPKVVRGILIGNI